MDQLTTIYSHQSIIPNFDSPVIHYVDVPSVVNYALDIFTPSDLESVKPLPMKRPRQSVGDFTHVGIPMELILGLARTFTYNKRLVRFYVELDAIVQITD